MKTQLYDIMEDPNEVENIADEYPKVLKLIPPDYIDINNILLLPQLVGELKDIILQSKNTSLVAADWPKGKIVNTFFHS